MNFYLLIGGVVSMFKKINFKKTWWIILLMFLLISLLCIPSIFIDYALNNPDVIRDSLNEVFIDKYTYQDVLMIIHFSYGVFLIVGLVLCLWLILWNLFNKYNK